MSYQRIVVDGKGFDVIGLQIQPWVPVNPAAPLGLEVLGDCRFNVSGRTVNDEVFSFNGLEAVGNTNWPPTEFRTSEKPHAQADNMRAKVIDFAHWG